MIDNILETARDEVGAKESPANSNNVKYNTWLYEKEVSGPEYPWCGAFVSWVYFMAGFPLGTIDYRKGFAGCPYAVNKVFKWGQIVPRIEIRPGDIVFFDWDGNDTWDHTGIFIRDLGNNIFETIEGNTALGNDSNGGEVMLRQRRYSVALFVRPNVTKYLNA